MLAACKASRVHSLPDLSLPTLSLGPAILPVCDAIILTLRYTKNV